MHQTTVVTKSPLQCYQQRLKQKEVLPDEKQAEVVDKLQVLYQQMVEAPTPEPISLISRIFATKKSTLPTVRGLYIWGGVGRGKTWLMDLFYQTLPEGAKQRMHFHRFMQWVHDELPRYSGQPDPLLKLAKDFADQTKLLCLDEFIVTDIGDAMILAGLLDGLFAYGVTLVATSNIPPDQLYENGLQRSSFLPAIAQLNQHTDVVELGGDVDFRLRYLEQAQVYHAPLSEVVRERLNEEFHHLSQDALVGDAAVEIAGRQVAVVRRSDDVVWFDFATLCGFGRSAKDYIEIANCYHTVLLSDIPIMVDQHAEQLRRFTYMVDEFYDRNIKLVISAEAEPERLYQGERMAFEYQRTASRLKEMQSHDYLAKGHRAI
ncbi:MAG: AFG1 family ATPase [Candidatus Polarisedimenticolaceae bacterium]|nr:AFG1 family ATPase [Candidatus Polarisedimenticolaceae bacterium]